MTCLMVLTFAACAAVCDSIVSTIVLAVLNRGGCYGRGKEKIVGKLQLFEVLICNLAVNRSASMASRNQGEGRNAALVL